MLPPFGALEMSPGVVSMFSRAALRPLCWSNLAFAKCKKAGFKTLSSKFLNTVQCALLQHVHTFVHEGLERCTEVFSGHCLLLVGIVGIIPFACPHYLIFYKKGTHVFLLVLRKQAYD